MWNFLMGRSVETWLTLGAGLAIALLLWSWVARGNEIDDLNAAVASEIAAHDITRASVVALETELANQNAAIEEQRAAADLARSRLAQAEAASAGSQDIIARLRASARSVPAETLCEVSAASKEIWR